MWPGRVVERVLERAVERVLERAAIQRTAYLARRLPGSEKVTAAEWAARRLPTGWPFAASTARMASQESVAARRPQATQARQPVRA
jgi:hypothetical protein